MAGHPEKLKTARETFDVPDKVKTYRCDLTVKDELEGLIRHVREEMKNVKYLINAAGIFSPKAFLDHTVEDYDVYLDLNYNFNSGEKNIDKPLVST